MYGYPVVIVSMSGVDPVVYGPFSSAAERDRWLAVCDDHDVFSSEARLTLTRLTQPTPVQTGPMIGSSDSEANGAAR